MSTQPRPRRQGSADEAAALAFATAESRTEGQDAAAPRTSVHQATDIAPVAALPGRSDETRDASAPDAPGHDARAHSAPAPQAADDRAQRIRRVLDFEADWVKHGGAKARAIRAEFGWSTTRYYQVLDGLLETQDAVRHDPMLVRRLLRLREGR
ncbi:DUF3263 domain-containing protein [Agrococcus sp. Marseille-P2731]|uniref:DUF3263 domain-containing protein n=1 Tax=Agrococcus sp. Marseille-P2731 TaxID=1841862 RepID=UPI0009F93FC7|nr:DUF3263 domain-containing protein [Agrococcus sp. Marseille-P2731]